MAGSNTAAVAAGKKTYYLLAIILFDIAAIGIIPLNLYLLHMPEAVSVVLSAFIVSVNLLFWIRGRHKKGVKAAVSVFSLASILISLLGTYCDPYWNSLFFRSNYSTSVSEDHRIFTPEEAVSDLDFAIKYLKKLHPALYRGMPEELQTQYELSRQKLLSCGGIDAVGLAGEIESVFSLLGDAHTHADAFLNERHFLKYIYEHNNAGDRVIRVNGMTPEELLEKNSRLISCETKEWGMSYISDYISSAEGLEYLGISVEDGVEFVYEDSSGRESAFTFTKEDFVTYDEYLLFNGIESADEGEYSFVSYEIDAEKDLAILTLDSCENNSEYKNCLKNMFTEVKEKGIRNVAVDLRNNGGGNSSVANEFLRYLDIDSYKSWGDVWRLGVFEISRSGGELKNDKYEELLFDGDLYLLTSVYTFSSAMDFAMLVKDNKLGLIIGQAPGNNPSSYGDISFFTLPNSNIFMQISTKKWYRIDESLENQLIEPDIECENGDAMSCLYDAVSG